MTDRSSESGNLHGLELRLPPLPQTLPEILNLLHAPELTDPEEMTQIVQRDPSVVARLLQQVNSAYYGLRRSITSVERAIRMLGPSAAAGAVISLSMIKIRKLLDGPAGPCYTHLVRHSVGTAFLARYLIRELPDESGPTAEPTGTDGFTEGLLHDFGKLVLIYNYPEEAVALYEQRSFTHHLSDAEGCALEQLVFGCDHTEAGAYAASALHFPSSLVEVIRYHHAPSNAPGDAPSRALRAVCGANEAIKAMDPSFVGVRPTEKSFSWETCATHPIWSHWPPHAEDDEQPFALLRTLESKADDFVRSTQRFLNRPGTTEETESFA